MLTVRDLKDQFEIQGKYRITSYNYKTGGIEYLASVCDSVCSKNIQKYLDAEIKYMYAENDVIFIEIERE